MGKFFKKYQVFLLGENAIAVFLLQGDGAGEKQAKSECQASDLYIATRDCHPAAPALRRLLKGKDENFSILLRSRKKT